LPGLLFPGNGVKILFPATGPSFSLGKVRFAPLALDLLDGVKKVIRAK
jgi:hypothetical protein